MYNYEQILSVWLERIKLQM